jgi:tyrosine-protein kinase Etk/Wzc
VVIMDTAPVGLVSDAVNLGKYADCTLYIVRQHYTFRKQLQLIEELYRDKKLPNISIVLNDVKTDGGYYGGSGYYGGYGYSGAYHYGSGYFEEDALKKKKDGSIFGSFSRLWKK